MRSTFTCLGRLALARVFSHQESRSFSRLPRSYLPIAPPTTNRYSSSSAQTPRLGQPIFETHPHLLGPTEITPGCSALEYAIRRANLASMLPERGIAVIASSQLKYRSGPVFYEFHQQPDFLYLTGFLEPESVCVIEKTGPAGEHAFHLFVREKDEHAELWDGARSGVKAAVEVFNADHAYNISRLNHELPSLVSKANIIFADVSTHQNPSRDRGFSNFFSLAERNSLLSGLEGKRTESLKNLMHRIRITKSPAEIANMRKAGKISGRAFNDAMRQTFTKERDLAAFLSYKFATSGCEKDAYVPVVASGEHALTIHYTRNEDVMHNGDLILVDAGGQYGGYVSDITRTWPVNGRFSPAQRDLYHAVLDVQKHCISLCRETARKSLDDIHRAAEDGLYQNLRQLGFDLSGGALANILFPHHVGHYIGLDLHDCGAYGRTEWLKAGQTITIEPGVYVPHDERWPKHFRGTGIRIEDSVCVGEEHATILSVEAVKEIDDIEALRE